MDSEKCMPEASLVEAAQFRLTGMNAPSTYFRWELIQQGGSDREFYRVRHADGKSWVVMRYSEAREENLLYVEIARFLSEAHLQVPKVLFHDAELHLVGLEDLGETSLYTIFNQHQDRAEIESLYRLALHQARLLHQHTTAPVPMMDGFDEALYRWERNYFLENLVCRWAGVQLSQEDRAEIEREGEQMAAELVSIPRCLIHRDFQSQNLMLHADTIWMIDFQGMRLGHAVYDVASLLYDPYIKLDAAQRASLLNWYASATTKDPEKFEHQFHRAAIQRLMQALGAYGFLGLVKGKGHFLQYIPQGLKNLSHALECVSGMIKTKKLLHQIQVETPVSFCDIAVG